MSNVAKLKKQAAEFELKKQPEKAIAIYVKLLESFDEHADELDVGLFNRVGDLMLRQGNVADAVDYYERAVDRYADTGFVNNAIALCNKILRHSPGRATVYYTLGKISAQKGFKIDAKVNFLEYADRMQKAGKVDEAFRALKEFADLCPDQHEIRLMLADQLTKAGRMGEAVDQLQTLYERYDSEGRLGEAAATAERMWAIDPSAEPRSSAGGTHKAHGGDLVFLDLDEGPAPSQPHPQAVIPAEPELPPVAAPLSDVTRIGDDVIGIEKTPSSSLLGLETTRLTPDDATIATPTAGSLLDIEPSSGADFDFVVPPVEEKPSRETPPERGTLDLDLASLTLAGPSTPASSPTYARPTPGTVHAALDGLPLMDLDVSPAPELPAPRVSSPFEEIVFAEGLELIEGISDATTGPELLDLNAESLTLDDDEALVIPTPSMSRRSTMVAVHSVEILKASVEGEPENWSLRRELAEVMLDAGDRDGGLRELEGAMVGAERCGDLGLASSIAEEIARLEPEAVKHHQKRVEYAFRINDHSRLIEAYLALADALLRSDQADKACTVYQRVLDLAPDDLRARAALDTIVLAAPESPPPRPTGVGARRASTAQAPIAEPPIPEPSNGSFINLGDWLRDDRGPLDTRMVVAEQEPSGDEDADFADMLRKFKQGVAENVDAQDYQSHYDLAIAYKEMGLLDEAIAQFQKALGSPSNHLPTYEALGQCFLDKGKFTLASSILGRALNEPASEDQLIGVLYLLGRAAEAQGHPDEALGYYQRVFVLDIQFRDVAERLNEVERTAR